MKSKEKRNMLLTGGSLKELRSNIGKKFYFKSVNVMRRITSLHNSGGNECHFEYYDVEGDRRAVKYEGAALFLFFGKYARE
jgi:hypothetical protein